MKAFFFLACLFVFIAAPVIAQPKVLQVASAKTPDCATSPINQCSFTSLTVSFAPSTRGTTLVAILDATTNLAASNNFWSCVDNFGQEWSDPPSIPLALLPFAFLPPENPSGLSSLTCKAIVGPPLLGFSILLFELSGVDQKSPIPQAANGGPPLQCGTGANASLIPGISIFVVDTQGQWGPGDVPPPGNAVPDNITPVSADITSAANLVQTVSGEFGDGHGGTFILPTRVTTTAAFYQVNATVTQSPTFSFLNRPRTFAAPACRGITFAPAAIVDPYPDLMNGFNVVAPTSTVGQGTAADLLATLGRPIEGVAADGTTQILVRVPARNVGDQFTFTVLDAEGLQSAHPSEDGTLGNPGDSSQNLTQSQISTFAINTSRGPFAFAVYRAPLDFPRAALQDEFAQSRRIKIEVVGNNQDSQIDVFIVRPPVALIHGIWSDWTTWNNFAPLVLGTNRVDSRFSVLRVSYDTLVGPQITTTDPVFFIDKVRKIKASSLGFAYNAPAVLSQMSGWLQNFRTGSNPVNLPVAAAQFDVVAHSMGGDIARTMPLIFGYLNNSNFGRGAIHKLITIDTPHLGSAVAEHMLGSENSCTRRWFAWRDKFSLRTVTFSNFPSLQIAGGVGDLSIGSAALQAIQGANPNPGVPPIPSATIAAEYTQWGSLDSSFTGIGSTYSIKAACVNDALIQSLTSTCWPSLFAASGDARNDGLVSVKSGLAGLPDDAGFHVTGFVHSDGLVGVLGLGFNRPTVLDTNTPISNRVIDLLNTAIPDFPNFKNLGPASQ